MNISSFLVRSLAVFALAFCFHANLAAQWVEETPLTDDQFLDFDFPEEKIGYALVRKGDGATEIFRSTDEGSNWTELDGEFIKDAPRTLQAISFPSEEVGYVVLRANTTRLNSYVFKTEDAGKSWDDVSPKNLPIGMGNADVFFTGEETGFCTIANRLFRTTDGGENWETHKFGTWTNASEVDFFDGDFGILGAWDGTFVYRGRIYTTKNGGETWDSLYVEDYQSAVFRVACTDGKTAYALANQSPAGYQPIYRTKDAGDSWDTLQLRFLRDSSDQALDMYFLSAVTGFLVTAKGYIYKTEDAGENWSISHSKTLNIQHISSNGNTLFVGGPTGTLLRSSNQVSIEKTNVPDHKLYPNPCPSNGSMSYQGIPSGAYELFNSMGQVITQVSLSNEGELLLSNWNLESGCYFLKSRSGGTTIQFMVQ